MEDETEIINKLFKKIKACSSINFPKYRLPLINEEELSVQKESSNIFFKNGENYDKNSKTLKFPNGQIFVGEIKNIGNKYYLEKGVYNWSSGQKYEGKFENNLFNEGELKYGDNIYNGKFKDGLFMGQGEFQFNNKENVIGNFENGEINGYAFVKKNNLEINGHFVESKPRGKISKFLLTLDNHTYEFKNFNYENEKILDNHLYFKKDRKQLTYVKLLEEMKIPDIPEMDIQNDELLLFKKYLNLIIIKIPEFKNPKISEEKLKVKESNGIIIKFENGEEANIDENSDDENELTIPNGEKFNGILDLENNYNLKEGKYIWPSGQSYEGKFNENNKFETKIEDGKLSLENKWSYKGKFKNGQFNDKGILKYENGKTINAYFKENKIMGHTIIKFENIEIQADIRNELISGIKINENGKIYKIKEINLNNNSYKPFVIIKGDNENEFNYFCLNYKINKDKIELEKINKMPNEELNKVLKILDNRIIFPPFEFPSINENSLIIEQNDNRIELSDGNFYDKEKETLFLTNDEYYKGKLENISNKFYLVEGEYFWPDGQKYIGKFNHENTFHSDGDISTLIFQDFTFKGRFENGLPNGQGELIYKNGDIIKGKFINGKLYGEAFIKKDNISFEANYIYSMIDGYIKNIQFVNTDEQINNNQFTVIKGKIKENEIKFKGKTIQLTEENRNLIPEKDYKKIELDEEDIIILFKFISKVRKLNLPNYEQPRISEEGIYIQQGNNLQNVKLAFPNNEIFTGKIQQKIGNKYMLVEGEYNWPDGQKYKGKFEKNRFCDESGELNYSDQSKFIGGFKKGLFKGYGKYTSKKYIIEGIFRKGHIQNNINIKSKNFMFEGKDISVINELYIKHFKVQTKEHSYEISDFNINNDNIIYKRDAIEFKLEISKELKKKIIESLLIRNKSLPKNFFYNNPYMGDLSNENIIKTLKIENNIYSGKLSKLTIYKNKLVEEDKTRKKEIKKFDAGKLFKKITNQNIDYRLSSIKSLREKINNDLKVKKYIKPLNFGEIEQNVIGKIFNRKMLKEMEKENNLLKQDINTLKMEKELIEKERYDKIQEIKDLNLYLDLIDNNYNDLIKEKEEIEKKTNQIHQELKKIHKENDFLSKYLRKNPTINNSEEISKSIREFEYNNSRILNEIIEKQERINEQNKEKEKLRKQIKELENIKNNIK